MGRSAYKPEEVPSIFASVTCIAARQRRDGTRWLQKQASSLGVREGYLLFRKAQRNEQISVIRSDALCDDVGSWHWGTYLPPSFCRPGGDLDAPVVPLHDNKAGVETHHITATWNIR